MTSSLASTPLLLTRLTDTRLGFSASAVREIVRSVAIAPLSSAPGVIEGAVNLRGVVIPVVDVRGRLGMTARPNSPDQFLVILETSDRLIAVRVDDVDDVVDVPSADVHSSGGLSPALQHLAGVAATADGALVIYDADAFLTQAERAALDQRALVPGWRPPSRRAPRPFGAPVGTVIRRLRELPTWPTCSQVSSFRRIGSRPRRQACDAR